MDGGGHHSDIHYSKGQAPPDSELWKRKDGAEIGGPGMQTKACREMIDKRRRHMVELRENRATREMRKGKSGVIPVAEGSTGQLQAVNLSGRGSTLSSCKRSLMEIPGFDLPSLTPWEVVHNKDWRTQTSPLCVASDEPFWLRGDQRRLSLE